MKERVNMPVIAMDHAQAKSNPWGLTAVEVCAMRIFCKHGGAKQCWAKEGMSVRTINFYVSEVRKKMKLTGHDVRAMLNWHLWYLDNLSGIHKPAYKYSRGARK